MTLIVDQFGDGLVQGLHQRAVGQWVVQGMALEPFWRYSLMTAKLARSLAGMAHMDGSAAYAAGLLPGVPALAQAAGLDATTAEGRRKPPTGGFPIAPGVYRLDGTSPDLPAEDLAPLRAIIGKAPVVALGEAYHTTGGFYELKHRVFRYLVENMGFRALAMESNWSDLDRYAAAYVATCQGSSTTAQTGHWGVFFSAELGGLLEWMCDWNRNHPQDRLTYFGFDIQQPQQDGAALVAFLGRLGIPADHRWVAGIRACDGVVTTYPFGQVPAQAHAQCLQALGEVEDHFEANQRSLERQTSRFDLAVATLQLVGLRASENQSYIFPHSFPNGITARDEGMAYAFLAQRALRAPNAKTVIWAANIHVSRAVLPNKARPLGSFLDAVLGSKYVTFALAGYETEIDYPGVGCGPVQRPAGGIEERLGAAFPGSSLIVDLAAARATLKPRRRYPMGVDVVEPHKSYNGILFLDHSPRMRPLGWAPCE